VLGFVYGWGWGWGDCGQVLLFLIFEDNIAISILVKFFLVVRSVDFECDKLSQKDGLATKLVQREELGACKTVWVGLKYF